MQRAPNAWDRFYRFHEAPWRGERELAPFLPWLRGRVLELGCGNGKALRPLQARGFDAVGLDVSFHALSRLGQGILGDASRVPFADASFATVLDIHCSGHLLAGGRAAAHAEQARVLGPGGHVIVERLMPDDLRAGNGAVVEAETRRLGDGRTTHFSSEASLRTDLERGGLAVVDVAVTRRQQRLRDRLATRASIRMVARRD